MVNAMPMMSERVRKAVAVAEKLMSKGMGVSKACKTAKLGINQFYVAQERLKREGRAQTLLGRKEVASTALSLEGMPDKIPSPKPRMSLFMNIDNLRIEGSPKALARFIREYRKPQSSRRPN